MKSIISDKALSQLFTEARTYSAWLPGEVEDETLVALYERLNGVPPA